LLAAKFEALGAKVDPGSGDEFVAMPLVEPNRMRLAAPEYHPDLSRNHVSNSR
jgi:hypothetical protein